VTGGLYAGVADAFPNGGGSRGFLFTVDGPQGRISWFFQNSASTADLTVPIVVGGVDFGAPLDNLKAAMSDAGLTSVDLWIGTGGMPVAQLVIPVLKPKAYLPVHWDDMWSAFLAGVPAPFSDPALEDFLSQSGVNLVRPRQYMDKWRLDGSGIVAIDNGPVKEALGFCTPVTTCGAGQNCGTIANGCGGTVSCGAGCTAPESCGGGGSSNVCGCTPVTTCGAGQNCGTIANGCGGTVSCGAGCTAPESCGGGGSSNVCGCTPVTTCGAGKNCGTIANGCGGTVSCGAGCTAPESCGGGGSSNVCGCTPVTTCGAGQNCGTIANGCGGTVSCGAECTDAGPDAGARAAGGGNAGAVGGGGAGGAGGATGDAGGDAGGAGTATETDGAAGVSADHDALGDASDTSGSDGSVGDSRTISADGHADGASAVGAPSGSGCGCRASGPAGPEPLLLVGVLGLIAWRTRRPPRRSSRGRSLICSSALHRRDRKSRHRQ